MNPIPVIGIPYLNRPDLLKRCIASIDHRVERVVIVDNSDGGLNTDVLPINKFQLGASVKSFSVTEHANAGVAASWNEVIKLFPAPWWLLVNNDIEFGKGDLARFAAEMESGLADIVADGQNNMACFGISSECVDNVGLFDENFYPAYYEDLDYMRRCELMGADYRYLQQTKMKHDQSSTVKSLPAEGQERNRQTFEANKAYYIRKWGGGPGEETYKTPFNDPGCTAWAWKFDTRMRKEQM